MADASLRISRNRLTDNSFTFDARIIGPDGETMCFIPAPNEVQAWNLARAIAKAMRQHSCWTDTELEAP